MAAEKPPTLTCGVCGKQAHTRLIDMYAEGPARGNLTNTWRNISCRQRGVFKPTTTIVCTPKCARKWFKGDKWPEAEKATEKTA